MEFPLDATEYDCLSIVRKAKARDTEGFNKLVLFWTGMAYGSKMPNNDNFKEAIAFCNSLKQFANTAASNA